MMKNLRNKIKFVKDGSWFNIVSHNFPVSNLSVSFSEEWYTFVFEDEDGEHTINFDTYHIRHYCDGIKVKTTNKQLRMMDKIIEALEGVKCGMDQSVQE